MVLIIVIVIIIDRLYGLWSNGQSFWLQIHMSGFDSRHYQIFWEAVGLERGPLSLMSTIEELLERKVAAPVQKTEIRAVGNPPCWLRDIPLSAKVDTIFAGKRRSIYRYSSLANHIALYLVGRTPCTVGDETFARTLSTHRHPSLEWDWTHDPSILAGEDRSCLRQRGHCAYVTTNGYDISSKHVKQHWMRRRRSDWCTCRTVEGGGMAWSSFLSAGSRFQTEVLKAPLFTYSFTAVYKSHYIILAFACIDWQKQVTPHKDNRESGRDSGRLSSDYKSEVFL
jgi:hypothetical protein